MLVVDVEFKGPEKIQMQMISKKKKEKKNPIRGLPWQARTIFVKAIFPFFRAKCIKRLFELIEVIVR